jgi:hypothetical protein
METQKTGKLKGLNLKDLSKKEEIKEVGGKAESKAAVAFGSKERGNEEKAKPEQWVNSPVSVDIATERMKQLKSSLEKALLENQDRGISFRPPRGGITVNGNPKHTYFMFGTEKMDKEFPQGKDQKKGTWRDGHKYCYMFHFHGGDKMKADFFFGFKDQDLPTTEKMKKIAEKFNIHKNPNREGLLGIKSFTSDVINLNTVFTYEQVLTEVNRIIDEIFEWEKDAWAF